MRSLAAECRSPSGSGNRAYMNHILRVVRYGAVPGLPPDLGGLGSATLLVVARGKYVGKRGVEIREYVQIDIARPVGEMS